MKKIYLLSILSLFLFASCEKVIDVDLNEANPQLVVEGMVLTKPNASYVKLHLTTSFYTPNEFPSVDDATVSVRTGNKTYNLQSNGNGIYTNDALTGEEGKTYFLDIKYKGKTITSQSTIPSRVKIDSLYVQTIMMGPRGPVKTLFCRFTDPENVENYYRFRVFKNDTITQAFNYTDDSFFDGNSYNQRLQTVKAGDSIYVQMLCVDKANYTYFKTIDSNTRKMNTSAPGNPVSNIEGEAAIGFFEAAAIDERSLLVKDENPNPKPNGKL